MDKKNKISNPLAVLVLLLLMPFYLVAQPNNTEGITFTDEGFASNSEGLVDFDRNLTIEFWIKLDASAEVDATILHNKSTHESSAGFGVYALGSGEERRIRFSPTSSGTRHLSSNSGIRAGEWTHVALVYDDGGTFIFLNGVLDASGSATSGAIRGAGNPLNMGAQNANEGFFRGSLDDLRIWSNSRSGIQIRETMANRLQGDEANLAHYYRFNESSGNEATDSVSGINLSLSGNVTLDSEGAFPFTPQVHRKIGNESVTLKINRESYDEITEKFRIYRSLDGTRTLVETIDAADEVFFTDSGLANGTTYSYEVTSVDGDENVSDFSNPLLITPSQQSGGSSFTFGTEGSLLAQERPSLLISDKELTIEVWVKRSADADGDEVIVSNKNGVNLPGFDLRFVGGGNEAVIMFSPSNSALRYVTSNTGIRAGNWTHIAAVYNDGVSSIYINGELDAQKIGSSANLGTNVRNVTIGANSAAGERLKGSIDELRIWSTARTNTEIRENLGAVLWGDEDGLRGYWRFDETSGTSFASEALRPLTLSQQGQAVLDNPGVFPLQPDVYALPSADGITVHVAEKSYSGDDVQSFALYRFTDNPADMTLVSTLDADTGLYSDNSVESGVQYFYTAAVIDADGGQGDTAPYISAAYYENNPGGQALRLDGSLNQYISFKYIPALDISGPDLTLEAWVRKDKTSQEGAVIMANNDAGSNGYHLRLHDAGESSRITFSPSSVSARYLTSEIYIQPDTWYHIAAVYNDGQPRIYINGILDNSRSSTRFDIGTSSNTLSIGAEHDGASGFFSGDIDEVRIWKRSLTSTQVHEMFNKPLIGNEDGLVGYWRFDEVDGQIAHSSAHRPISGQLENGAHFASSSIFEGDPNVPALAQPANEAVDVPVPTVFSWHPVAQAKTYTIEISADLEFKTVVKEFNIPDTTTTIQMGIEYDSTYYWRVKAETDRYATHWSDVFVFTAELPIPEVPDWQPHDGETGVDNEVLFVWSASERAKTYDMQLAQDENFDNIILDVSDLEETEYFYDGLQADNEYFWRVRANNRTGSSDWSETLHFETVITSANVDELPLQFALGQNYPNPFNPTTIISYQVPEQTHVRLTVYDMLGRVVATLVNEQMPVGSHQAQFDAANLSSGVYVYRMEAGDFIHTQKMMLVK